MKSEIRRRRIISFIEGGGFGGGTPAIEYTLYPSTDRALTFGSGAKDYESFGNFIFLSNGRMVIVYRKGSDHNAAGDGDICFRISDDGGVTLSAEVVLQSPEANLNKTNPNCTPGDNDRVMMSWTEIPIGPDLGNPTSVKSVYSDDLDTIAIGSVASATFSSEFTFGQTFSAITFEYIDGPGKAIRAADGSFLKPIWVTGIGSSQPQTVAAYRSTDNMATFTYYSTVNLDAINPCDECCFILLSDNRIVAGMRCNSIHKFRYTISSTNGNTWGATTTTTIDCYGKPAGVQGPNGTIGIIARDWFGVSNRTILMQSNDGAASFTSNYIDARTGQYMYGDVGYHATYGVRALWWMEAENSTSNQGPTILLSKTLVESATPVAPPTVYDPDYQSMRDFGQARGYTLPTGTLDSANNTFIAGNRTDVNLTMADGYWMLGNNDTNLSDFANINCRRGWLLGTPTNSPTYGVNGYDFNGSTQYFDTNLIISQQANFLLNTCEVVFETTENVDETARAMGCGTGSFSTIANATFLSLRISNTIFYALNSNLFASAANASSQGFYAYRRTTSTAVELLKNSVSIDTDTTVSTGRSSNTLIVGAARYVASINLFATTNCRFVWVGGLLTDRAALKTRWDARLTAIGLTPN